MSDIRVNDTVITTEELDQLKSTLQSSGWKILERLLKDESRQVALAAMDLTLGHDRTMYLRGQYSMLLDLSDDFYGKTMASIGK